MNENKEQNPRPGPGNDEPGDETPPSNSNEASIDESRVAESSAEESGQDRSSPDAGGVSGAPEMAEENVRLKETLLRLRAEMDNREKRLEREMVKTRKFALESLLRDLIPVLDSLDQALAAEPADSQAVAAGVELTRRQAIEVLTRHGLEVLDPAGEAFDPNWHEAVTTQPSTEQPSDSVLQVLQKGYRLNERLIRPARVIVARAP
ncbi:MAG: nucleotide exchange factor GrpE [Wenzhouxiangellaceae bacterium]|nr:nucleotide exchange factor GrpE [Wenzhouxiangellaceae bacterium]